MGITFDSPPLAEVSLGSTFLPRPDFLVPHFGAFWSRIRDQFPDVAQAAQIVAPNELPLASEDGVWLPRIWYLSSDKVRLLQLQQNRLHFNWRRTTEDAKYVRFPAIQAETLNLWDQFSAYVLEATGSPLQPLTNELVYTNMFALKGKTAFEIADETLRDSVWCREGRFLLAPTALAHSYSFNVPDELGELTVSVNTGNRPEDGSGMIKIDLTIRGAHRDDRPLGPWSQKAHDFVVEAFKDLTTSTMHKKWGLRDA